MTAVHWRESSGRPGRRSRHEGFAITIEGSAKWQALRSERFRVGAILLVFAAGAFYNAWVRPFWFDELSTLFMTATPTLGAMFRAVPTDGNPPLYFLLARVCLVLPLPVEFTLRLPAVGAYLLAAVLVYGFVRRAAGPTFALLSMSLFLGSGMAHYAVEARAYSLLMACTMVTLFSWQTYCRGGRKTALIGMALGICGAIASNQYGVIYSVVPLVAGELIRSWRRRAWDVRVVAVALCSAAEVGLTFPVMLKAQQPLLAAIKACPVFSLGPGFRDLADYREMLPHVIWIVLGLAAFGFFLKVAVGRTPQAQDPFSVPREELAVAIALSSLLPVMLLVTHFGTGFFQARYGIGSSLGLAMLMGLALGGLRWRHSASIAWIATLYSVAMGVLTMWLTAAPVDASPWVDPVFLAAGRTDPIVIASALEFSPLWWYDEADRGRLHYLSDLPYATQHSDLIPEFSLALEHRYTPMQMESYAAFVATHDRFMLYSSGQLPIEWITPRLIEDGWRVKLLASATNKVASLKEGYQTRKLYLVTRAR